MRVLDRQGRTAVFAAAALAAAFAGCKGCQGEKRAQGQATPAAPSQQAGPIDAATLAPVIREMGPLGELPESVVIEFTRDVAPPDLVGKASPQSQIALTPPVKGVPVFTAPSTLTFKPEKPFDFATQYSVALLKVETRDGVLDAPAGGWAHQFTTPGFGFVRLSLERRVSASSLEADVVFSGAVKPRAVEPLLAWEVDGQPMDGVRLSNTTRPNVLRAAIQGRRLAPGATIRLTVKAGIPAANRPDLRAPASEALLSVPGGEPVTIQSARLREGTTGFYVEVVCDDAAAKGPRRHHWDREEGESRELSSRCVLSEEEAPQVVRFSPLVKFHVAPGPMGFRIFGDFARGPVSMVIDAGARTQDGGTLQAAFERSFSVPARRPQISFAGSGRYLPRSAWRSLPISHLNVDRAELAVRHVAPENLIFWLSDDRDERATERTSDLLLRKTIPLPSPADKLTSTWVDVASLLPATTKGVLELTLQAPGARASARILLTGMNLIAKRSAVPKEPWRQEVLIWAFDMDSTELLSGVEATLLRKSGKVVGRCTTAGETGCRIQAGRDDADESEPFALVARKGDDLTYIRYADLKTDTSEADVHGESFAAEAAYRAAVWSDRGVYRPGDVAHVAAILRDREYHAPQAGMPVEVQLVDPREKIARRIVAKTNEAGLVTVDLPFAAFADTGRYQVNLAVAERKVGGYPLNVEEFVPERMKVQAATDKPSYLLGGPVSVSVDARYLFGGSAEGSSVEVGCSLEPATFKPAKQNANFTYGPRSQRAGAKPVSLGSVEGKLDKKGHALLACPPSASALAGPSRMVASAAVFEGGSGRSSVAQATAAVHPERYYIGLDTGARRAQVGKPVGVKGVVVDWDGALAPAAVREVSVELVRLEAEYGWWWDEEEGAERFDRSLRAASEGTVKVKVVDGRFSVDLVPREPGAMYVVRARAGQTATELELEGAGSGYYWHGAEARADRTPRPLRPTALAVELPQRVRVGEKATARFTAPFRGRALLTVETDRVVSAEWKKVEPGAVSWSFSVPSFFPNVYVSLFLVKDPHIESAAAYLPDRAFGVVSAPVEPVEFTSEVRLELPAEVRSNAPLAVRLQVDKVEGPTFAVVAAVDEGILQLTRMKSPDPFEAVFARRALGVDTFETVGWTLLVPPQGPSRTAGGDQEGKGAAGRVQPVKPVALWSGVVPVGPGGKAEVQFQVPQYRGQLRVMAVVAGRKRMGRAAAPVTVRDPIVLSTTLPRFVTQNDVLNIPVFVTNLSGGAQTIQVALSAENLPVPGMAAPPEAVSPVVFLGRSEGSAKVENGASATLVFQVRAAMAVGAARFRVVARAGSFQSEEQLDVPFLPAGPRERIVKRIEVDGGTLDLRPQLQGWVPTSERSVFWLTANPYGESFDHLKFLIHYPYGCVEQTTSSTRPLLFAANLIDSVDPSFTVGGKLEEMVVAGIQRLLSMQTPSGGLAYWPGGTEPYAWGTAYATHSLLDAQKLGYPVPQDRLDQITKWIEGEVDRMERGERRNSWEEWHRSSEAYLHYVLALAGKGHKARIQRLVEERPAKRDGEALEREYMLKAALWLAGDRRYEADLRNTDVSAVSEERRNSWSFYSDRRRRGFMLSTFQDLFGSDPFGEPLAQRVAEGLRAPSSHYTTQELVWGVTGLGKRVGNLARDFKPGRLLAGGKALEPRPARGRAGDRTWALARASEYKTLQLQVDAPASGKLYLILSSEGVREKPEVRFGGSGLALSRTYRTIDGGSADPRSRDTSLAGLLLVEITVRNTSGERIQNVALVDRIPAGFEIENPRLGRGTVASWIEPESLWKPDFLDVRDDRLVVFGALEPRESRKVVYAVRAVTAGTFTLPPVEAEAMYDPRIWAREQGGTVKVASPWKDSAL